MPHVRPLPPGQAPAAAALLGRAFRDVPAYLAIFDPHRHSADERLAAITRVKRGLCEAYARYAEADALWEGDRLLGVALAAAPGRFPLGLRADLFVYAHSLALGPRIIQRFLHLDRFMAVHHLREPHYYLFVLGVEPDSQGRGHGKALLRALNARADARGVPCYLETDRPENVRLYRSVGYEVVHEGTIEPLGGLRMWTMQREPR